MAEESGIAGNVVWMGWQADLADFYHAIDVLLFNAEWDASPTTPQEAMSHGIPVVASCVHGGLGEVIVSEQVGVLMGDHNIELLSAAVVRFLEDPNLGRTVGLAGRNRIAVLCDPARIVTELEELLS